MSDSARALRRAVIWVAALNLAYFFVEFGIARAIASVALFADSIDFLEDASVNFLVLLALGWTVRKRAMVGLVLAALLLVPGIATAWMAWSKFNDPVVPAELPMTLAGLGALAVNVTCAYLLVKVRNVAGSLSRAAFLSARNDAYANGAIVLAAGVTVFWPSAWPDLIVGIGILLLNLGAAREVFEAARREAAHRP
ncbi:MAG: cation efflux protein [Steroidobacteraceae bacterium]|jgi:Co/Zn/Cd efflux system component|nr:cation efflux protein [Steroidobacteraceae bacterium]